MKCFCLKVFVRCDDHTLNLGLLGGWSKGSAWPLCVCVCGGGGVPETESNLSIQILNLKILHKSVECFIIWKVDQGLEIQHPSNF